MQHESRTSQIYDPTPGTHLVELGLDLLLCSRLVQAQDLVRIPHGSSKVWATRREGPSRPPQIRIRQHRAPSQSRLLRA